MDVFNFIDSLLPLQFLALWLVVLVGGNLLARWYVRRADQTDQLSSLPVSPPPDVFELAYLRGGERAEVARLAVLELLEEGYLEVYTEKKWRLFTKKLLKAAAPQHPPPAILPANIVYGWFQKPQVTHEVRDTVLAGLKGWYDSCEHRLWTLQLYAPLEAKKAGTGAQLLLMATLLALLLWQTKDFVVGHLAPSVASLGNSQWWAPMVLTALLVIIALTFLAAITFPCRAPRLSKRGQTYLRRLQETSRALQHQVTLQPYAFAQSVANPAETWVTGKRDSSLLLVVALFGSNVLSKTPYDFVTWMFRPEPSVE